MGESEGDDEDEEVEDVLYDEADDDSQISSDEEN